MRWILAPLALAAASAMAQFDGPAPLAWRWSESTSASPAGSPAVEGDTVYVAVGGRIYALDRATGNQLWRYPAGEPLTGNFRTGIVKSGDLLVAASDQKILYGVDAKSGQLKWQFASPSPIVGAPVSTGTEVVAATSSGSLVGVSASDGQPLWGGKEMVVKNRLYPNLGVWQGGVIYGTSDGLTMFDANTGKERWTQKFGRLSSSFVPVVFNDGIYVNSGSYVICLRASSGSPRWQQNVNEDLTFSPGVSSEGVVALTQNEKAYVFDLNGRFASKLGYKIDAKAGNSPSWAGKFPLIPTAGGSLLMIDPKTGDRVWSYAIPQIARSSSSGSAGGPPGGIGGGIGGGIPGLGGAGGGGRQGAPGAGLGGGSSAGGQAGGAGQDQTGNVPAAGAGVVSGDTLCVLALDGSLLAFDKSNGVDLTAPVVKMLWPSPGDLVSPNPPAELIFKLEDYTSGINPASVKLNVNGSPVDLTMDKEGIWRLIYSLNGKNKSIPIGRTTFSITASDWLGNTATTEFVVLVDPAIDRPLGSPPSSTNQTGPGRGPGNGGGGGGSRNDG